MTHITKAKYSESRTNTQESEALQVDIHSKQRFARFKRLQGGHLLLPWYTMNV
jgi:hypothetical protein